MRNEREILIDTLSRELAPVRPMPRLASIVSIWLVLAAALVLLLVLFAAPFRPFAVAHLADDPWFALEMICGGLAIGLLAIAGFRAAVPGELSPGILRAGSAMFALWVLVIASGWMNPALEPSMVGKRTHCHLESLAYGMPAIIAAAWIVRRLYVLKPLHFALPVCMAAGAMPAWFMQLACRYEPGHALAFHVLPGMVPAFLGVAIARAVPSLLQRGR